jgi:hypothetical protein
MEALGLCGGDHRVYFATVPWVEDAGHILQEEGVRLGLAHQTPELAHERPAGIWTGNGWTRWANGVVAARTSPAVGSLVPIVGPVGRFREGLARGTADDDQGIRLRNAGQLPQSLARELGDIGLMDRSAGVEAVVAHRRARDRVVVHQQADIGPSGKRTNAQPTGTGEEIDRRRPAHLLLTTLGL